MNRTEDLTQTTGAVCRLWVRIKFGENKNRNSRRRAEHWLGGIAAKDRNLFAHWKFGILPTAG